MAEHIEWASQPEEQRRDREEELAESERQV